MEDYQGTEKLTEISARQWQYVTQENLSAREAVAFLRSGMQVRSFRDVLRQVCGTDQVEQQLTLALCQLSGAQPDSVRRKVWNWMNGRTLPTEREEVLRICFALELPLEQADRMLTLLTDQGIHYRNLWEVVCAYCLRQGLPYGEAKRLMEQLRPSGSRERGYPATQAIRQDFQSVRGEERTCSPSSPATGRAWAPITTPPTAISAPCWPCSPARRWRESRPTPWSTWRTNICG